MYRIQQDIRKFEIWNSHSGVDKDTIILVLSPTFREITASLSSGSQDQYNKWGVVLCMF